MIYDTRQEMLKSWLI